MVGQDERQGEDYMTPQEKLVSVALAEEGYIEKATNSQLDDKTANPGKGNWTKYARDLDSLGDFYNGKKNGYDWCDVFADWDFVQAFGKETALKLLCAPIKSCGAGCKYSAQYYKDAGRFFESDPLFADQIFFGDANSWWHTGIVIAVDDKYVYTIEGNTTSAAGAVANGGCVARKRYLLTYQYIKGYGRPDWSIAADKTEEEDDDMDVAKFKELMREARKELQDNDSSAYSEEARKWAVENGLVAGGSTEEFNGMWEDFLTREQLVTVLYRFAQKVGLV